MCSLPPARPITHHPITRSRWHCGAVIYLPCSIHTIEDIPPLNTMGLYKYMYTVRGGGAMQIRACSRRIASASEVWG